MNHCEIGTISTINRVGFFPCWFLIIMSIHFLIKNQIDFVDSKFSGLQ
jgi:hypothetical protein